MYNIFPTYYKPLVLSSQMTITFPKLLFKELLPVIIFIQLTTVKITQLLTLSSNEYGVL